MSREAKLPGVAELFRRTGTSVEPAGAGPAPVTPLPSARRTARRSTGRQRHDEKITVYVTSQELVDIETARLTLRSQHGLAIDRGRLVREAIAMALAEMEERGAESELVHRLSDPPNGH
jgi:hypothetical protein